ncbi:TPA: restriction endonuclease subunit S [Escherichia coli]|jgi:type I restriction enzyme, S subunit|uniref:Restriction endonuclease subunit S n=4 Tax=Enterobacteriaceae TaxID=543 RepID=A0A6X8N0D9_SALET|nr:MULTISPECIES: restriction endonuclease subunit S [Escherichia]EFA4036701.1 restriction endonuclease subunit S [Escherichia coli O120:H10]EFA4129273.1 restriction endonuclease subunit S [Escherichia coli O13]EFN8408309.1 restriction endonuclease subunit S [Escherichia coli O15]HAB2079160.1 restriction endonuclease subunit S [Salmonella enterica subsp. enterica serovar Give]AYW28786.1 restriction endonuclease subunit S [Escherichia coli]
MMKISEMPKYDDYVDSGVEWLGRVPASWELTRLGTRFNERRSKVSDIDYPALSVTKKGVLPQLDNAAKTKDGDNRKLVKEGDFVINSRSDRKGSSGVSDRDGSVSLINIVLKPKGIHPKFSEHLLKSHAFIEEYYRVGRGIVADLWTTRYDEMRTITISVPSLEEQTRIANFLDKKTALIDEAISIKEKQINLLKEHKQIIIQQAVTQGLDPNVPMKDSGVDWIGDIPEHWEVVPLKRLAVLSPSVKVSNRKSKELVTFLAMEKVSTDGFIDQDTLMPICDVSQGFTVFNRGDVIVAKITPCFENGKSAWLNNLQTEFGYGSTEFHVLRCGQRIIGSFLYLIVSSPLFLNAGEAMMTGSAGQKRVPSSFIQNFPTAIPGVAEQEKIVSKVKELFSQIDVVVASTVNQIEKLKEYKTTLINSAVTGKIKITPEMVEQ